MTNSSVAASDFCAYYTSKCGTNYASTAGHFADMADCVTKYTAYSTTLKACTTYHLCVAGTSAANALAHCLHPAASGQPMNMNPCGIP